MNKSETKCGPPHNMVNVSKHILGCCSIFDTPMQVEKIKKLVDHHQQQLRSTTMMIQTKLNNNPSW